MNALKAAGLCPARSPQAAHVPAVNQTTGAVHCGLCQAPLGEVDLKRWWTDPPAGDRHVLFLFTAKGKIPEPGNI